eukprot:SAG31_NODE_1565_length_7868_cov_27.758914_6_plen_60_part_00
MLRAVDSNLLPRGLTNVDTLLIGTSSMPIALILAPKPVVLVALCPDICPDIYIRMRTAA